MALFTSKGEKEIILHLSRIADALEVRGGGRGFSSRYSDHEEDNSMVLETDPVEVAKKEHSRHEYEVATGRSLKPWEDPPADWKRPHGVK